MGATAIRGRKAKLAERDPEMDEAKMDNQYCFGMDGPIGVAKQFGCAHNVVDAAARAKGVTWADALRRSAVRRHAVEDVTPLKPLSHS